MVRFFSGLIVAFRIDLTASILTTIHDKFVRTRFSARVLNHFRFILFCENVSIVTVFPCAPKQRLKSYCLFFFLKSKPLNMTLTFGRSIQAGRHQVSTGNTLNIITKYLSI